MSRSKIEDQVDAALKVLYPHDTICEEEAISPRKGITLFVDRMIKPKKLAFEIDGRQHDEFVEHFHRDAAGFASSQERDRMKTQWLKMQGYTLIRIKHNEKIDATTLRAKVLKALDE